MKIELIDPETLKSAAYNPRQITREELNKLIKSIKQFGFVDPASVRKQDNMIVGGHQRVKAAIELGLKEIPVVYLDITENDAKLLNVALNKISGDWDEDKLTELLTELKFFDDVDELLTGFDEDELDKLLADLEEPKEGLTDDDAIPEEIEAICKEGQLWQLGDHRLVCGDATKKEDVDLLMDGNKADMVFTDPPYGINVVKTDGQIGGDRKGVIGYEGKAKTNTYKAVIGDDKPFDPSFLLTLSDRHIIWGANNFASKLPDNSKWIVWDKKGDIQLNNDFSDVELAWTNFEGKSVKKFVHIWAGMTREGNRMDELSNRVHPTQKPVGLFTDILDRYADKQSSVGDLYLGSGSTLIACEKTNRKCYGMELDPHYCDVIIKRWEDYTGQKAELLDATL